MWAIAPPTENQQLGGSHRACCKINRQYFGKLPYVHEQGLQSDFRGSTFGGDGTEILNRIARCMTDGEVG
jgi:hypothetical protein